METSSSYYKLPSRTIIRQIGDNTLGIIKDIKSRIIKKDALKIVTLSKQIKECEPSIKVVLVCQRNICSKSITHLSEHGIEIIYLDETHKLSEIK